MRRVVLFHKDGDGVEMRHYAVQASAANVSKPVKRVVEVKNIPDLSKLKDISEYVTRIDPGSDSEGEDAVAPMAGKFGGRGNVAKRESKIKLVELGPRLRLRLYKVERGVCSGDVLYHAFREDPGEASRGRRRREERRRRACDAPSTTRRRRRRERRRPLRRRGRRRRLVGRAAAEEAAAQGREAPVRAVSDDGERRDAAATEARDGRTCCAMAWKASRHVDVGLARAR